MKAFVTGGTGLLGSNLVALLTQQGHQVKALARSKEKAAALIGNTGAEIVIGDMDNIAGFADALDGIDILFHTAAYFRDYYDLGDHWPMLKRINVDGTINLLHEAEKRGVKKVIYVSSVGVIGLAPNGQAADETTPPDNIALEVNLYYKSKVLAEQAVEEFLKTHALPVVMILPTAIFGPFDAGPTSTGKLILDFLNDRIPAIPPAYLSVIDARDLSQAMINAVERGRSGERYIVSRGDYSLGDVIALVSKVTGKPAPTFKLPYPAALAFAWWSETRARFTGTKPVTTLSITRSIHQQHPINGSKAVRELGATFRPFEETVRDTVTWYVERNYVSIDQLKVLAQA